MCSFMPSVLRRFLDTLLGRGPESEQISGYEMSFDRSIMRTTQTLLLVLTTSVLLVLPANAQQSPAPAAGTQTPAAAAPQTPPRGNPKDTEVWEPVPPIVTPGR